MRKLAILGASGHGRVVADTALQSGWNQVVFFDDAFPNITVNSDWVVAGNTKDLIHAFGDFAGVAVAIGNNRIRLNKVQQLLDAGLTLPILIHPQTYIARNVEIEVGTVIFAGAIVQPGCVIGLGSIVNTGAMVDHDCSLAAGVHVCPGVHLAGGVRVGECSWIGIGSVAKQYLTIGDDVTVGAGAVCISDIPNRVTVVGNPARILQYP
jgi:sugar O-acyltransferase (sialic acid O-acetyltransferase NeuD family)